MRVLRVFFDNIHLTTNIHNRVDIFTTTRIRGEIKKKYRKLILKYKNSFVFQPSTINVTYLEY